MPFPAETYPWHAAPWALAQAALGSDRVPHAWLFAGAEGLGKLAFAERLAARLLCETPSAGGDACGSCRGCRLLAAGSHPDFTRVRLLQKGERLAGKTLSSDSTSLRIDQVREMIATLSLSAQYGRYKVALLAPADLLVPAAANALLKTLEEPTANTVLILVAARPWRLPATVRSRCQVLGFAVPARAQAEAWLAGRGVAAKDAGGLLGLAEGRPLQALELAGSDAVAARAATFDGFAGVLEGRADPLSVAASWAGDAAQRLRWAAGWMVDLARLASVGEQAVIDSPDLAARLHPLAQRIDLVQLFNRLDQLQESRRLLDTQVNTQLLCEQLLLDWDALARRPGA